jgi:exodeoxyribonuclease-3
VRLRIVSWNINSIRVRLDNLARLAQELRPDVICLQETKVEDRHFPTADVAELGYPHVLTRGIKGYNGVAVLSRLPMEAAAARAWCGRDEGRHVAARITLGTLGPIRLDNFYVPSGGAVPDPVANPKFAYKLRFLDEMTAWVAGLKGRRVILMGDLNVAPLETDVWNHKQLLKVVTHTPAEVERMERLMAANEWVDAVRHFVPPSHSFTAGGAIAPATGPRAIGGAASTTSG